MSSLTHHNKISAKSHPVKYSGKKTFFSEFFFLFSLSAIILSNIIWFDLFEYFGDRHKLLAIYVGVWAPTTMSLSYIFRSRKVTKRSSLSDLEYK